MRYSKYLVVAALLFFTVFALAQKPMDEASEKNVHITSGPSVTNNNGSSATVAWTTDHQGANHLQYRRAGSNEGWKSVYHQGGGTQHSLHITGLTPGQTYEYQILTRDGDVRTSGQFVAGSGGSTTPASTASAGGGGGAETSGANVGSGDKVALYRAYNASSGVHVIATSQPSMPGFATEGTLGYVLSSQKAGTLPLYKVTNAQGDTLLLTDVSQRNQFVSQGYRDDGVVGYVAQTHWRGTEPLYRMAGGGGLHYYTVSESEHAQAVQQGWRNEGIVGYIWAQ